MNLKRIEAIELLAALRGLDGIRNGDQVTAFTFKPEVVDKIVSNILLLRPLQIEVVEYQKEVGRMTWDAGSTAEDVMGRWLAFELDLPLQLISKSELNPEVNPIPVSVRVGLAWLDPLPSKA